MVVNCDSRVGILVLGMHRSGTSAVTGVLEKLGIPVPGQLLPPAADNPKGFFENKASLDFNEKLLNRLASQWDDPLAVSLDGFHGSGVAKPFEAELEQILRAEFLDTTPIFALKEPRLCRFVPIWRRVLDKLSVDTKVIVVVRHPSEVADSLASRDGLPRAKTLLLWLQHMLAAERDTRGMARSFLPYAGLMDDWRSEVDRTAVELDLVFPMERARAESLVDDFLSRDLRHHIATEGFRQTENATGLEALAARAFSAFIALCGNRHDAAASASLDAVSRTLAEASAVFAPYIAWEFRALNDSRGRVAWLEEIERVVRDESAGHLDTIATLNAAIGEERNGAAAALAEAEKAAQRKAETAEANHRQILASERGNFLKTLDRTEQEISALRPSLQQALDRAVWFEQRSVALEEQLHDLRAEADVHPGTVNALASTLGTIGGSTAWRLTGPLRRAAGVLPVSTRWHLRRLAKASWWVITPWRTPARLRMLRDRQFVLAAQSVPQPVPAADLSPPPPMPPPLPVVPLVPASLRRGISPHPVLGLFDVPSKAPRVSMVTDSINEGSLFGGVATALIFTALLAKRTGRRLRIVTRTQAPAANSVAVVFRAHGIDWSDNIEFVFADMADPDNRIDTHAGELFVTTSWWTTRATRQSVADRQILYLLQEDERMFYPSGDSYLACAETLGDRSITKVINSGLLHQHLVDDGIIDQATPFFEPSFPRHIYFPAPKQAEDGKHNFFFYARPYNARNLYDRGVAVIEAAIERGILDPSLWNIHFVGKDLTPMQLAGGVEPILLQNLAWEDYAAFVRSVDLALTLMYTPHPSYPPLDVAACGGIALTNRFGVKTDLSAYSRSILCVDSELEALVEGLRLGVQRALDSEGRRQALANSGICRDWAASFAPVFDRLADSAPHVY